MAAGEMAVVAAGGRAGRRADGRTDGRTDGCKPSRGCTARPTERVYSLGCLAESSLWNGGSGRKLFVTRSG